LCPAICDFIPKRTGFYGSVGAVDTDVRPFEGVGLQVEGELMARYVNEVVEARCQQSRTLISQIERLMPAIRPCCRRHDFAVCAIDLALEHHRAAVMLVETGELGSAAALSRPLLEASASAFWLVYVASDQEVLALPIDPAVETSVQDIPMLSEMATSLKPYFPAIEVLTGALSKKGSGAARWLHKYTHGGTPQLVRRDRANGWLEGEVILGLLRADLFAVLGASVLTVLYQNEGFCRCVFGWRDALGTEVANKFGAVVPERQPQVHPTPDKRCCGAPL
jgi:hypothetical protein